MMSSDQHHNTIISPSLSSCMENQIQVIQNSRRYPRNLSGVHMHKAAKAYLLRGFLLLCLLTHLSGCETDVRISTAPPAETSATPSPAVPIEQERRASPGEPRPAIESSPFNLQLQMASKEASSYTVHLIYQRRPEQSAPRTAEILIEYPEELRLAQVNKLTATMTADKDLIVQHPSVGRVRLIWMSIGHLGTIDSGPLAELVFTGQPSPRSAVHILSLPHRPWFAPPAANDGVVVSDPLLFEAE